MMLDMMQRLIGQFTATKANAKTAKAVFPGCSAANAE